MVLYVPIYIRLSDWIRRTAVRETIVSRLHGYPIEETFCMVPRGLCGGTHQVAPIMKREASFSDSWCQFFIVRSSIPVVKEKILSNSFQIERYTIVETVFLLIMNPMDFRLVHNQKEICRYDRIPFNLKITRKRFLWVYGARMLIFCLYGNRKNSLLCSYIPGDLLVFDHISYMYICICSIIILRLISDYIYNFISIAYYSRLATAQSKNNLVCFLKRHYGWLVSWSG